MNRHKLWVIFVTLVAFLLSSCSNPDSVELVIDGTNLVRPGEKVEITALVGENVSELVWSITDESLGILAVSPDKPYQAFLQRVLMLLVMLLLRLVEARADSIQLLVADLAIAGAGWHFTRQGGGEVQSPDNRVAMAKHSNFSLGSWRTLVGMGFKYAKDRRICFDSPLCH